MHAQAREFYCCKKLGLLLFTIFTALAYHAIAIEAVVVVRGQGHSAEEAGSAVGYEEGRRLAEHGVSTMTELFNRVCKTGSNKMANGDTATLSVGQYKCSDGTCEPNPDDGMIRTIFLSGTIQCLNDDASCVLDGELNRRVMRVAGTSNGKLTIRAIRFYKGKHSAGGGVELIQSSKVDIVLCVFDSCEAYSDASHDGKGAAINLGSDGNGGNINIYATTFVGNSAPSGGGNDIYAESGTVTIHDTCPSPYSANTPTKGKKENDDALNNYCVVVHVHWN